MKLPYSVRIKIHIEPDGGFWAEFPDLPGCYTQGDLLNELPGQIEDALLTYFDVSREKVKDVLPRIELKGEGRVLQPA